MSLDTPADYVLQHRLVQAYDMSEFMRHTWTGCDLALMMGDCNTEPDSLCGRIIKYNSEMVDAWDVRGNIDDVSVFGILLFT